MSQKSFNTALIPDFLSLKKKGEHWGIQMGGTGKKTKKQQHRTSLPRRTTRACQTPSLYELSPPYPSLYKHHRLPYLPPTQNKQHQGEDKKSSSSIPHERVLEISPVSPPPVPSLIQSPPCLKPSAYPSFPPTVTHSAP